MRLSHTFSGFEGTAEATIHLDTCEAVRRHLTGLTGPCGRMLPCPDHREVHWEPVPGHETTFYWHKASGIVCVAGAPNFHAHSLEDARAKLRGIFSRRISPEGGEQR